MSVKSLSYDENFNPLNVAKDLVLEGAFSWTLITIDENTKKLLMNKLRWDSAFTDDILEEQRPNIITEGVNNIIVLSFPIKDKEMLQITFVLVKNHIITITNKDSKVLEGLFETLHSKKVRASGITNIFSIILDNLIERSIQYVHNIEEKLDEEGKHVNIEKMNVKNVFEETSNMKENLFLISRIVRSDTEVISDILANKVPNINLRYFGEHVEDRLLYMIDYIDFLKESVHNDINTHLALLENRLNEQIYKLTIIGSLLIVPTIIAGFFGMNVNLPLIGFWEIIGITIASSLVIWLFIRKT
ncbi:CorA-like Mg2+ transporter protein [Candidatus Tiddalikarchaeum anstoanum]|nr:CorA-like Mg2+ transporter protein [Candidatus Tiddalikarchaeum anstoanum]